MDQNKVYLVISETTVLHCVIEHRTSEKNEGKLNDLWSEKINIYIVFKDMFHCLKNCKENENPESQT